MRATRLKGIGDALDIMAEEVDDAAEIVAAPRPSPGGSSMTPSRLGTTGPASPSGASREMTDRLARLATAAETLIDITQALALERAEAPARTCCSGREAVRNSIASHERDLDGPGQPPPRFGAALRDRRNSQENGAGDGVRFPARSATNVAFHRIRGHRRDADESCYDLLASEARLASYVGIAKGDLPARHWFRLGHDVTPVDASAALISWSGSMFEYLMPSLVMRAPTVSVLEQTNRVIVRRQIEYGESLGTPWGISESAYNARDRSLPTNTQTSEFQGLV